MPDYGDLETIECGKDNAVMRQAAATKPLGQMPLAVLALARQFDLPKEAERFSCDALEPVLRAANENLATLVSNAGSSWSKAAAMISTKIARVGDQSNPAGSSGRSTFSYVV